MKTPGLLSALLGLSVLLISCNKKTEPNPKEHAELAEYISAYTSGIISKESTIRLVFTSDMVDKDKINQPVEKAPLNFVPSLKGEFLWTNPQTLEFRPSEIMPPGTEYTASLNLKGLLELPPGNPKEFNFKFTIINQSFSINIKPLKSVNSNKFRGLDGSLTTADTEDGFSIEKILSAKLGDREFPINWRHESDRRTHQFWIDSIPRTEKSETLILIAEGGVIGVKETVQKEIVIPSLSDYKITELQAVQEEQQYVLISTSDLLQSNQNLDGIISIAGIKTLSFRIEGNQIKVFQSGRWRGKVKIEIAEGLKNQEGNTLSDIYKGIVEFKEIKPGIKIIGKGTILPGSEKLLLPFEAVNLKAIDVTATEVYADNIPQFLQDNDFSGTNRLKYVGREIWVKTVELNTASNQLNIWNTYSLDLTSLLKKKPGALYHISLNFRMSQSLYFCGDTVSRYPEKFPEIKNKEDSYYYHDYGYDYDSGYNYYSWRERENPCHPSYYVYNSHKVSRNFLASNLGLIAKMGTDGELQVVATNILDTKPLSGVEIKAFNFQNRMLNSGITDNNGISVLKLEGKAFFITASMDNERGYLKVGDGNMNTVSHFDVAGEKVQDGLKGFLYGERGVWRPGDSLYLTFILEDKEHSLPQNHPITFEFYNPKNQLIDKQVSSGGVHGFYRFATATSPNDPTGFWSGQVHIGGSTFGRKLKIETVMPNRLKINLKFGSDYLTSDTQIIKGIIESQWLHGAPARGLKAKSEITLVPAPTNFKKFPDFIFSDPSAKFQERNQEIFDLTLDSNGTSDFEFKLNNVLDAPGMLQAKFKSRVFESGGGFSVDYTAIDYYPFPKYLGIRVPEGRGWGKQLVTDTTYRVQLAGLQPSGEPTDISKVEISLYKINWRWWWDREEESLANFINRNYNQFVEKDTVAILKGKGYWDFKINKEEWGRYLIKACDVNGKHCTGKIFYADWPGWGNRGANEGIGASVLSFKADKDKYQTGEIAHVTIPAPEGTRVLLSLETGSKILKTMWLLSEGGYAKAEFNIVSEMAPNFYIHAMLIQPHKKLANDRPIRLYGVIPIDVVDSSTILTPQLTHEEVFRPGSESKIMVREQNGRAMTYTLAIVDEGLLDLTHFKTPNPHQGFYKKEALGVKTWDLYNDIAGNLGDNIQRLLSIGGDESVRPKEKRGNRFPPMVIHLGPFHIESGEKKEHRIQIPQYVGSVRVMAVAGQSEAYGMYEKAVPVRNPLMVLGVLPRVLGPQEEVSLPISVFAMENSIRDVDVSVRVEGSLDIMSEASKKLKFNSPGDELIEFKLKAGISQGWAKVHITAKGSGKMAEQAIEIEIRNPIQKITEVMKKTLQMGESWNLEMQLPGVEGTNNVSVEVSRIPDINMAGRLNYLIRYPHGCIEQTTSSIFPQLYLPELIHMDSEKKKEIEYNVTAGINKLRNFQLGNGGFVYWPGNSEVTEWGSNYVGHFLLEAKKAGYSVSENMLSQWKNFQKRMANSWYSDQYRGALIQAYRLYTLALAGEPELAAMNRLRESPSLQNEVIFRLAAAYQLSGQEKISKALISKAYYHVKPYCEHNYTYGSSLRDSAMILETMVLMGNKQKAKNLMVDISERLSSNDWMSTQTTSYCLMSVAKYTLMGIKNNQEPNLEFNYGFGSKKFKTINGTNPVYLISDEWAPDFGKEFKIENKSNRVLYVRLFMEGKPPYDKETDAENGLYLNVEYSDLTGNSINLDKIIHGVDLKARVSITNKSKNLKIDNLVLSQIFPSGFEIHNERMEAGIQRQISDNIDYQDIRDDRIYSYFNLGPGKSMTLETYLNASYLGKFYLPAVNVEAMYDASINARKKGKWLEIVSLGK